MFDNDLLSYMFTKFKLASQNKLDDNADELTKERLISKLAHVEVFVEYAKQLLRDHPPVAFDYVCEGNAVTLNNGDRLRFVPMVVTTQEPQMYEPEIPITSKNRQGSVEPSHYVKI